MPYFRFILYLCNANAVIAQLVERWLPKPKVAGSSPVYRSRCKSEAVMCEMLTVSFFVFVAITSLYLW